MRSLADQLVEGGDCGRLGFITTNAASGDRPGAAVAGSRFRPQGCSGAELANLNQPRALRPAVLAAAVVTMIALVAVVVLLTRSDGGRSPGPVVAAEANELSSTVPTWRMFMYGIPVVYHQGEEPATLERATFVKTTPGIEISRS